MLAREEAVRAVDAGDAPQFRFRAFTDSPMEMKMTADTSLGDAVMAPDASERPAARGREEVDADFEAAGFKMFTDHFKAGRGYACSWQKRVVDERGTRYFVTVDVWDFARDFTSAPEGVSLELSVQFHTADDMCGDAISIRRSVTGAAEAEAKTAEMWLALKGGHYETRDGS